MPSMRDANKRYSKYYADLLNRANNLYLKGGNNIRKGLEVLDEELINIQNGQAFAEKSLIEGISDDGVIEQYISPVDELLELRLNATERIRWSENALERAQKSLKIAEAEAIGIVHRAKKRLVAPLINLGNAYFNLAEYEKAQNSLEQALTLTNEIDDNNSKGRVLNRLGDTLVAQEKYDEGIDALQQSLKILQFTHSRRDESNCLRSLGNAYIHLEQYEKAIEQYQGALLISKDVGDKRMESKILYSIGSAWNDLEQPDDAVKNLDAALSICREIGDKSTESIILGALGLVYNKLREYEKAQNCYDQSLVISRQTGDRFNEASQLYNLGRLFASAKKYDSAIELFDKVVEIFVSLGLTSRVDGVKKELARVQAARRFDPSRK